MFRSWRYNLRQAESAFQSGRIDDAVRLLTESDLGRYLPGQRLSVKVADTMALRARRYLARGDSEIAWREVERTERLFGQNDRLNSVRNELIEHGLIKAEDMLRRGDPSAAIARLERLLNRKVRGERVRTLMLVARRVNSANALCRRGKFAAAQVQLDSAAALRPDIETIGQQSPLSQQNLKHGRCLTEGLHRAIAESDWSKVVSLADELLQLSPENALARDARQKAWTIAGTPCFALRATITTPFSPQANECLSESATCCESEVGNVAKKNSSNRFLLWVDAVGGYLVCLDGEVVLGQAIPDARVDVPILGDLSRRHLKIRRQNEQYLLEPYQQVKIDGRTLETTTMLSDGDEIELGSNVRLRFRKPHALSATARLDFVSRHRTQPWADAVLLMAESCVLGPNWRNHVTCRDWPDDVVLYREDDQLFCRAMDAIEIDGQLCDGRGKITRNSHVAGVDFAMSLEEI